MTTDRFGATVLSADECWRRLRNAEVGRLAVVIGNRPDIFPVNHLVDHGTVVFRTAGGTKFAAAVLGESVAFEVDGYDPDAGEAWSVVLRGRAVEVDRLKAVFDGADMPPFPWHAAPKGRVVRIEPEDISGRRFHVVDSELGGSDPSSTAPRPRGVGPHHAGGARSGPHSRR
jgi:nitroimidazol reductase NimA-like FMN-containing flavoprotein (pyridoxamine 5'-phosphate oxidase superfamily)